MQITKQWSRPFLTVTGLEYAYQNDEAARDYAELGMDLEQAVKYVYRGAESVEDDATQENLSQIRESLEAIGQTVE